MKQVGLLKCGVSQAWLIIRRTCVLIKMHIPRPHLEPLSQTFRRTASRLNNEGSWGFLLCTTSARGPREQLPEMIPQLRVPQAMAKAKTCFFPIPKTDPATAATRSGSSGCIQGPIKMEVFQAHVSTLHHRPSPAVPGLLGTLLFLAASSACLTHLYASAPFLDYTDLHAAL